MSDIMGEFVDFPDIFNQINRREMNKLYEFNLMIVGLTGVGKSTLVKSLFRGKIKPEEPNNGPELNEYSELLEEYGVKLQLRCIETSNYDPHNSSHYKKYIDEQLKSYFMAQRLKSSWNITDNRIHCCLYLIPPYGKMKLRKEDLDCMRELHERVNLIPLIAKADLYNTHQLNEFKENIIADLDVNGIKYFKFQGDEKEDEDLFRAIKVESEKFPFAIVAADGPTIIDNKRRWIRDTISSQIDIFDKKTSDFGALAKLLVRYCILDLIDSTHEKHYSKFKAKLLEEAGRSNYVGLQDLGLDSSEAKRIINDITSSNSLAASGDGGRIRRRTDKERELQALRARVHTLKAM